MQWSLRFDLIALPAGRDYIGQLRATCKIRLCCNILLFQLQTEIGICFETLRIGCENAHFYTMVQRALQFYDTFSTKYSFSLSDNKDELAISCFNV